MGFDTPEETDSEASFLNPLDPEIREAGRETRLPNALPCESGRNVPTAGQPCYRRHPRRSTARWSSLRSKANRQQFERLPRCATRVHQEGHRRRVRVVCSIVRARPVQSSISDKGMPEQVWLDS